MGGPGTSVHSSVGGLAVFGATGTSSIWRYLLMRQLSEGGRTVGFVMLNPSTADAMEDDPAIRRCIGFARRWGFERLEVCNVFAYRSTDPRRLRQLPDPEQAIGPMNDRVLLEMAGVCEFVVCAWGNHAGPRGVEVEKMLRSAGADLRALRLTKIGAPGPPLYLPQNLPPTPWLAGGAS